MVERTGTKDVVICFVKSLIFEQVRAKVLPEHLVTNSIITFIFDNSVLFIHIYPDGLVRLRGQSKLRHAVMKRAWQEYKLQTKRKTFQRKHKHLVWKDNIYTDL